MNTTLNAIESETKIHPNSDTDTDSFSNIQRHLLVRNDKSQSVDQSESSIVFAGSKINTDLDISRKLSFETTRNKFDKLSPKQMKVSTECKFSINSIKELNQNKSIEQISLVLQCDPTKEGNGDIYLENENKCQAQPKRSDKNTVNTVNANCQPQLPAEKLAKE